MWGPNPPREDAVTPPVTAVTGQWARALDWGTRDPASVWHCHPTQVASFPTKFTERSSQEGLLEEWASLCASNVAGTTVWPPGACCVLACLFLRAPSMGAGEGLEELPFGVEPQARDASGEQGCSEGKRRGGEPHQGQGCPRSRCSQLFAARLSLQRMPASPNVEDCGLMEECGSVLSWFPGVPRPPSWNLSAQTGS